MAVDGIFQIRIGNRWLHTGQYINAILHQMIVPSAVAIPRIDGNLNLFLRIIVLVLILSRLYSEYVPYVLMQFINSSRREISCMYIHH